MKGLGKALWTETLKVRRSKILWATIGLFAFVALMMGLLMSIAMHPELAGKSSIFSAKATFVQSTDWKGYFSLLIQIILTLGTLGFGVVTAWAFGREFSDKVISDLLSLPVSRLTIITAKFIVVIVWCVILTLTVLLCAFIVGSVIHLGGWSPDVILIWTWAFFKGGILTILVSMPAAFIASYGRGYLLAIGYVLLTLVTTQFVFMGVPGITPYFPWAIPALTTGVAGPDMPNAGILSYLLLLITCAAGYYGTYAWWRYADQK